MVMVVMSLTVGSWPKAQREGGVSNVKTLKFKVNLVVVVFTGLSALVATFMLL